MITTSTVIENAIKKRLIESRSNQNGNVYYLDREVERDNVTYRYILTAQENKQDEHDIGYINDVTEQVYVTYREKNQAIGVVINTYSREIDAVMINENDINATHATVAITNNPLEVEDDYQGIRFRTPIHYTSFLDRQAYNRLIKAKHKTGRTTPISREEAHAIYHRGVQAFNETVDALGLETLLDISVKITPSVWVEQS